MHKFLIDVYIQALTAIKNSHSLWEELGSWSQCIASTSNNIICVGVGKSGLIAQRAASSLRAVCRRSFFLHAEELVHGDLGGIKDSVVWLFSKSGRIHPQVINYLSTHHITACLLSMNPKTRTKTDTLWNYYLYIPEDSEVCLHNFTPTLSYTLMSVVVDMVIRCVQEKTSLSKDCMQQVHPGGSLGYSTK